MFKSVTILGSTGSIGTSTLSLIEQNQDYYSIVALTANKNVELLIKQALQFRPQIAVIGDESLYKVLKDALKDSGVEVACGKNSILDAASMPADWIMAGIVGVAGLIPTLEAIKQGTVVALANKECLVSAGELLMSEVKRSGTILLPVDSEHNAVFQVFDFENVKSIKKIILTASGGPFRTMSKVEMKEVTPEQAINHPNWDMGAKISVDSATMMNKGLELIEAYYLFPIEENQIDIIVHPQSIVHSMVEYKDGSVLAQMGCPDMRTPIGFCLGWPHRITAPVESLNLAKVGRLDFEVPDIDKFPCLTLAREALKTGGTAPTILNAANEVAVEGFLNKEIGFLNIAEVVENAIQKIPVGKISCLDQISNVDEEARVIATESLKHIN